MMSLIRIQEQQILTMRANYKMKTKQIIKKDFSCFFTNLLLLKNFGKTKLRIAKYDCVDRYVNHIDYAHIDYAKGTIVVAPLCLLITEFYGLIEIIDGRKYLSIALITENEKVLTQYEKMWDGILQEISDYESLFKKNYHKIKLNSAKCDDDKLDLPLDKLIKFSAVTISNRLIIKKDDKLFFETYLEECLYDDYWSEK